MKRSMLAVLFAAVLVSGCTATSRVGRTVHTRAESLNILGLQIPGDPHTVAAQNFPADCSPESVFINPNDTQSVLGVLNRIFGFGIASIGGTCK